MAPPPSLIRLGYTCVPLSNRFVQIAAIPYIAMELKDARANFMNNQAGLLQYQLTFGSNNHGMEHMTRYLRITQALGIDLIQVTSATGVVTTKELDAIHNKCKGTIVLVGYISDCEDATHITFNLPTLISFWNIHKKEKAIVYNSSSNSFVMMNWGRAKGVKANVTTMQLTKSQTNDMLSQTTKWPQENFMRFGVNFTMTIMDRSLKEQISVEALMSLTRGC